ncbi:MAG: hypothetical protein QM770_17310 [Tepidisphaeraceae bacterium]
MFAIGCIRQASNLPSPTRCRNVRRRLRRLRLPLALHHGQLHLAVVGNVAEEVAARGFALDKANLRQILPMLEVVVVRAKDAGADGIDDAERMHLHLGRDATVAHAVQPAAGFFLQRLMQFGFATGKLHLSTPLPDFDTSLRGILTCDTPRTTAEHQEGKNGNDTETRRHEEEHEGVQLITLDSRSPESRPARPS